MMETSQTRFARKLAPRLFKETRDCCLVEVAIPACATFKERAVPHLAVRVVNREARLSLAERMAEIFPEQIKCEGNRVQPVLPGNYALEKQCSISTEHGCFRKRSPFQRVLMLKSYPNPHSIRSVHSYSSVSEVLKSFFLGWSETSVSHDFLESNLCNLLHRARSAALSAGTRHPSEGKTRAMPRGLAAGRGGCLPAGTLAQTERITSSLKTGARDGVLQKRMSRRGGRGRERA
jgi:hypothetical protein